MTSSVRLQVAWSVFLPRGSRVRAAFSLGPRALRLQAGPQRQAEEVWVAWPAHLPTWPPAPPAGHSHEPVQPPKHQLLPSQQGLCQP